MKQALGMIETKGLVALVQATDAMLKAAEVKVIGWNKIGGGLCSVFVSGNVSSVRAAVDAGAAAAKAIGEVHGAHVIANPHDSLWQGLEIETARPFWPELVSEEQLAASPSSSEAAQILNSLEAQAIKEEICGVGKKLWTRMYVDGNGGNISYRIGPNEVICTPTLVSKYDLRPEDLCLVDLDGNQLAGSKARTSEIFLHLEIYKAVPEAKAVLHCHPPHATAYAITGRVPPNRVVPEYEVFVGKVAVTPYETPGTPAFAQTVLPYAKQHNTILLGNHGIVCWADTVTHAEWYAEVVDTYCWTLMLAAQMGVPISYISQEKAADLLAIKKRLGLPDVRFDDEAMKDCQHSDLQTANSIALQPDSPEAQF